MVLSLRSQPMPTAFASASGKTMAIGSRVAGRYRVVALLHDDGIGHACVAVDERPGGARQLVVLETLPGEQRPSSAAIEAFVHDARLRERMKHPNVVQTLELVQHDGLPVLVTEYLEGESLATLLALAFGMPEFSLEVRLTILAHAVRGLAYIHQLGAGAGRAPLVHANVSPHDIVISYDGVVKLSGFGSAAGGARRRSNVAFAPANLEYLAPERLHASLQPASDVFAAGILLWELVALQRFWNQLPEYEIRRRLVAFDIPDIARLRPQVSGELARICRQALAADPSHRFPSAAQLSIALERFLVERSAVAAPATIALVMNHACGALQREAQQRLASALDAALGASRRSEAPSEVGIWHVLTKERPMPRSTLAAWAAGALAALSIAIAAYGARTSAPSPSDAAKPVALDAPREAMSSRAPPPPALPALDEAGGGEGSTLEAPEGRSSTTTIQTLMPERTPRSAASAASRAKPERSVPALERRKPNPPEPRALRARRPPEAAQLQSLDAAGPAPRDEPALSIRLER